MHLSQAYHHEAGREVLAGRHSRSRAGEPQGRRGRAGRPVDRREPPEQKLQYVGRRTISKYGCSGCHDIPGFENAKPIGTGLADWGRKDPSKLAFEQIDQLHRPRTEGHAHDHGDSTHLANVPRSWTCRRTKGYFMEKLEHHQREGFIWQKLREPRSYDYKKTENKTYNERLRMPQVQLQRRTRSKR